MTYILATMATKEEFLPVFEMLCEAYTGRLPFQDGTLMVWYKILKDLPVEHLQAAALEFMSGPSAFPPTPGQIRGKAIELQKRIHKVPSAAEAWAELLNAPADGKVRSVQEQDDPDYPWLITESPYQFSHVIVEKVARDIGWPKRFWTDSLAADRARFLNAYEQELSSATTEATSLPEVQEYIERLGKSDIKQITDSFKREAFERNER